MHYRGTADDGCAARFLRAFPAVVLVQDQEDFLLCRFGAFFDFGFRSGLAGSKIHAGGSLAGNDSWEASSTGSNFVEPLPRSCWPRSPNFGGEGSRFSAGLVIRVYFTPASDARPAHPAAATTDLLTVVN
jgi:hypothetical protein